jgi:hypothetical protein
MKIVITESQHNFLLEQVGMTGWSQGLTPNQTNDVIKGWSKPFNSLSVDDTVDAVSAMIDGIPGIGNLISAGIDVVHSLSYAIRFYYAKDENEQIEMATLGIITLAAAAIPVGGNALPIIARQGIKTVLRKTPQEILLIGKQLGLYKQTVFLLSKAKWKYNLLLVLGKILGNELLESLTEAVKYIKNLFGKIKNSEIKKSLKFLMDLLNDILSDIESIKTAVEISKKL